MTGKCLRQVAHTRGHLWHIYSVEVNQVMVATVKFTKWRLSTLLYWMSYLIPQYTDVNNNYFIKLILIPVLLVLKFKKDTYFVFVLGKCSLHLLFVFVSKSRTNFIYQLNLFSVKNGLIFSINVYDCLGFVFCLCVSVIFLLYFRTVQTVFLL
jgi:hypothetical protein